MQDKKLYLLSFFSDTEEDFAGFDIGLFRSREEAEAIASHYRKEVPGFKDYDCDPPVVRSNHCDYFSADQRKKQPA